MISTDLKEVSSYQLIEYLQQIELNKIEVNFLPYNLGFELYFVPEINYTSQISNIELICNWAVANEHSVVAVYSYEKEAITICLKRLYPDE